MGPPRVCRSAGGTVGGGDAIEQRQAEELGGGHSGHAQPVADPARAHEERCACLIWQGLLLLLSNIVLELAPE